MPKVEPEQTRTTVQKPQDNTEQNQDKLKKSLDKSQNETQDNEEDTETMEIESPTVSVEKLPLSRELSQPKITERDLQKHNERLQKAKMASELLSVGYSVRDVAVQTGLPKGFVEKLSKKVRSESDSTTTTTDAKKEYLNKPFEYGLKKLKEEDEDDESLLDWGRKTRRRIDKWAMERDMMREAGLIGGNRDDNGSSRINIHELLLAKILASGGSTSGQELASFAASLVSVFAQPKNTADPIEAFSKLQNLENVGIERYKNLQATAFQQAQASANKGIIQQAIDVLAPSVNNLTKALTQPQNIPQPTAPAPAIPAPDVSNLPQGEVLGVADGSLEKLSLEDSANLGYSNLNRPDLTKKTQIE
jgi:hypothetical protein